METFAIVLEVPRTEDEEALADLARDLVDTTLVTSRRFDGIEVLQALFMVSASSLPILKTWLTSRAEARKATSVAIDGLKLNGYTTREVKQIIEILDNRVTGNATEAGSFEQTD
jgi:hypothetical protein